METVDVRVARGAGWLDAVYPEWWTKIDVGTLDLHEPCRCVLGQISDSANDLSGRSGYRQFISVARRASGDSGFQWAFTHGFNGPLSATVGQEQRMAEMAALDEAWIAEIKRRWERGL